jgi:multicomponent K+:H+ antiporter subunit E
MKRPMQRLLEHLLPAPLLSLALGLSWLMLNESTSTGHLLLALGLALALPWFTERLWPARPRVRSWRAATALASVVLYDIVKSNVDVARRVLGSPSTIEPRFFWVPLQLQEPHAIVLLAGIITTTPGTVSAQISADRRWLLVHALHCPDDATQAAITQDIQTRYEAPLKEIFE